MALGTTKQIIFGIETFSWVFNRFDDSITHYVISKTMNANSSHYEQIGNMFMTQIDIVNSVEIDNSMIILNNAPRAQFIAE